MSQLVGTLGAIGVAAGVILVLVFLGALGEQGQGEPLYLVLGVVLAVAGVFLLVRRFQNLT